MEVTWLNPDNTDNQNPSFTRYSNPFTITVANTIYYPQWEPEIGELDISAYFAKTTCLNTDWQIAIYDAGSNLVKTLTGHTTDGTITAYWNMIDSSNVARTNADVDPYFDSVVTVSDPVSKNTPRKNQRRKNWPSHAVRTIVYQDFFKFEYDDQGYMKQSLDSFAYTAQAHGGYLLYYPQPGQTNDIGQTYPIRMQKNNHYDPTITDAAIALDHAMLLGFLTNTATRNLYLSSHGSPSTVAAASQHPRSTNTSTIATASCSWTAATPPRGAGTRPSASTARANSTFRTIRAPEFAPRHSVATISTPITSETPTPLTVNGVDYDDKIAWQAGGFILDFLFYWDAAGDDLSYTITLSKANLPPISGWYPGTGRRLSATLTSTWTNTTTKPIGNNLICLCTTSCRSRLSIPMRCS